MVTDTYLQPSGAERSFSQATHANMAVAPGSSLIAFFLVLITSCIAVLLSDQFYHWFLIPVSACGILVGTDAIDWARGRVDLYDPVGIVGIYGVHFFYLAPLLHVQWDLFIGDVPAPPDWRDWLGAMAMLNAAGLVAYIICRSGIPLRWARSSTFWEIHRPRIKFVALPLLFAAMAAQILIYASFGGIGGFMEARLDPGGLFEGLGWAFMIAESVAIITAFIAISYSLERRVGWPTIVLGLLLIFVVQMLFGGLRGSRSQTVNALIWITGCIHLLVRPVPRKLVCVGLVFLVAFMYLYGFYKELGPDATRALSGSEERAELSIRTGRTLEGALLGDLGRADIQAFTLYRLWMDGHNFTLAWGRTYLGALSVLIPRFILPNRPESVMKEGTDIQSGPGSYVPRVWSSTRVYGLAGEAMLNFSPFAVPFAYGLFGLLIGSFRNFITYLQPADARLLLVPFGVFLCVTLLAGDSDNLTFGLAKDGFMPMLVVLLCSIRYRLPFA